MLIWCEWITNFNRVFRGGEFYHRHLFRVGSGNLLFFSFFLDKKRNKKIKAVRCGKFLRSKIPYNELPGETVINPKDLRLKVPLRAVIRFPEALYFSL
jgi:hypothetical protein